MPLFLRDAGAPAAGHGGGWGREIRATVALGGPMILGQSMHVLMHAMDAVMVARLGVEPLAAAAAGNNAAAVFYVIGVGLGSTVPVLAAQAYGAGDRARMNRVLRHGLTVSLVYGLACVAGFAWAEERVLGLFGDRATATAAHAYALLLIVSLVPALVTQNLRGFAEAQNRPWLPLGNILLGVGLNLGLNVILIFGVGPWPGWGLAGAAAGTLLARVAMLGHFAWVLRRDPTIAPQADAWRPVGWRGEMFGDYFRLALPSALVGLVVIGNMVVVTALVGRLGTVALAANEIGRQLVLLAMPLPVGLSWALAIRVGQAVGRRDRAGVQRVAWSGLAASAAGTLAVGALLWIGREDLPRWFVGPGTGREELVATAAGLLTLAACAVAADGIVYGAIGICRGLAAARGPAAGYALGLWGVGLPLGYVWGLAAGGGVPGVWTGVALGNAAAAVVVAGLMMRTLGRWRPIPC